MQTLPTQQMTTWFAACRTEDVPDNGGVCVKYRARADCPVLLHPQKRMVRHTKSSVLTASKWRSAAA